MTKIHCTLEETVKREGLQILEHWLDHHGAEQSLGKVNCVQVQHWQLQHLQEELTAEPVLLLPAPVTQDWGHQPM